MMKTTRLFQLSKDMFLFGIMNTPFNIFNFMIIILQIGATYTLL